MYIDPRNVFSAWSQLRDTDIRIRNMMAGLMSQVKVQNQEFTKQLLHVLATKHINAHKHALGSRPMNRISSCKKLVQIGSGRETINSSSPEQVIINSYFAT